MLRSRREFAELQVAGRSRGHRLILVRSRANSVSHDRFGISTGRKVGGAVERNRVRRRIREAVRHMATTSGQGRDILIVARPASASATYDELRSAIQALVGPVRTGKAATST